MTFELTVRFFVPELSEDDQKILNHLINSDSTIQFASFEQKRQIVRGYKNGYNVGYKTKHKVDYDYNYSYKVGYDNGCFDRIMDILADCP